MRSSSRQGFTLLELLTVIAIIAILAAMIMVAGPRLIRMAKERQMQNSFLQIRTALTAYYADYGSYPPRYGYLLWHTRDMPLGSITEKDFCLRPYMAQIGEAGNEELYDVFSSGYNTNPEMNDRIDLLEFHPIGIKDEVSGSIKYPKDLYIGNNVFVEAPDITDPVGELARMEEEERRPYIYVPVNLRQYKTARRYWLENGDFLAENWDPDDEALQTIEFPPPKYDAFVLIGMPAVGGTTAGVVAGPYGTEAVIERYHTAGLRTYYLATRDLNNNDKLDFEYRARIQGEARETYAVQGVPGSPQTNNNLPSPTAPEGYGPAIYKFP